MVPQLQRGVEQRRSVDVGIAVDLPVAQKLGVLETRNQTHDPLLFGEAQVVLEADQVVAVRAQILLPQLHGRIRPPAGARIGQAHRLHRTETQRVAPAPRDLLDGEAGFEVRCVIRDMRLDLLCRDQFVDEAVILGFGKGAVQIIACAVERFVVARRGKGNRAVHRMRIDNRADAVVEEQPVRSGKPGDVRGESVARQWAGGDDHRLLQIDFRNFLVLYFDARM